jgi:hypothetical protein
MKSIAEYLAPLRAAEERVRAAGNDQVALAVALDNYKKILRGMAHGKKSTTRVHPHAQRA